MSSRKACLIFAVSVAFMFWINLFALPNQLSVTGQSASATPTAPLPMITADNAERLAKYSSVPKPPTLAQDDELTFPVWSPDGKILALTNVDSIFLYRVPEFSAPIRQIKQNVRTNTVFSRDSSLLVTLGLDTLVHVYDVVTGKERYAIADKAFSVKISPDGKLLALEGWKTGAISLFTLDTGERYLNLTSGGGVDNYVFSPDGSIVATIEERRALTNYVSLWSVSKQRRLKILDKQGANPSGLGIAFSPDGKVLAVKYYEQGVTLWNVSSGEPLATLAGNFDYQESGAVHLEFSPNGTLLAGFGQGRVYLWKIATTEVLTTFDKLDGDRHGGLFNLDGSLLVYWDFNDREDPAPGNRVRLWDILHKKNLITLAGARDPVFSPDGTMLATWGEAGVVIWAVQ